MPTKTTKQTLEPNKLEIKLGYNLTLILPFEKGLQLIDTLEYAEMKDTSDYQNPLVLPYKGDITADIISNRDYKNWKANALIKPKEEE